MLKTPYQWEAEFRMRGSLWTHSGNPSQPHPILTGEMHSSMYTNSRLVTADRILLMEIANDLARRLIGNKVDLRGIDRVVGPQSGATELAKALSNLLTFVRFGKGVCGWASPKKIGEGVEKKIVFDFEADPVNCVEVGETVLVCEDVTTTHRTLDLTIRAVIEQGGRVLPFVVTMVNQSGCDEVFGCKVIPLFNRRIPLWPANECNLCDIQSQPIRPKDNWGLLNA